MQPIPLLKDLHTCAWCENTAAFQTADRTERRNDNSPQQTPPYRNMSM